MISMVELVCRFKRLNMSPDHDKKSEKIHELAFDLASHIDEYCYDSREKSLALTKLEECLFWVDADLSRN